jgi:hypothetical protein
MVSSLGDDGGKTESHCVVSATANEAHSVFGHLTMLSPLCHTGSAMSEASRDCRKVLSSYSHKFSRLTGSEPLGNDSEDE